MDEKDTQRLKEELEKIMGHEVSVEQAKKVAVFVKLFVSMGADYEPEKPEIPSSPASSQVIRITGELPWEPMEIKSPFTSQFPKIPKEEIEFLKKIRHLLKD